MILCIVGSDGIARREISVTVRPVQREAGWAGAVRRALRDAGEAPQEDAGAAQASPRGVSPRRLPAAPFDLAARVGPVNKASDSLTRSYVKETAPIIKWIIVIIFIMLGLALSSRGGNSHSRKYYGFVSLLNIYIYIPARNTQIPSTTYILLMENLIFKPSRFPFKVSIRGTLFFFFSHIRNKRSLHNISLKPPKTQTDRSTFWPILVPELSSIFAYTGWNRSKISMHENYFLNE